MTLNFLPQNEQPYRQGIWREPCAPQNQHRATLEMDVLENIYFHYTLNLIVYYIVHNNYLFFQFPKIQSILSK